MKKSTSGFADINFRTIFNTSLDAIFIVDTKGWILVANRTAAKRYGYSLKELKQMNISDLTSQEMGSNIPIKLTKLMRSKELFNWKHYCKDGSELPVEVYTHPIIHNGKYVIYFSIRDTSLRKNFAPEQQNHNHFLERILNTELGLIYIFDFAEQKNVYINPKWLTALGYTIEEIQELGQELTQILHPDDLPGIVANHNALLDALDGEMRSIEFRILDKQSDWRWLISHETPFSRDEKGLANQILGIAHDITQRKHAEILLSGQNQVLDMIASGISLSTTLTMLIQITEDQVPGMMGSILLLDEDGVHIRHGAAPSLPTEFIAAIDGLPIGPVAGSCGTAAFLKKAAFVEDIATDPLWEPYRAVALPLGLRACWSTPIFDVNEQVLGTFAMYYRQPDLPGPEHLRLIDAVTHIAAIAINRHKAEKALRQSEARYRSLFEYAPDGIVITDSQGFYLDANTSACQMLGYSQNELIGLHSSDIVVQMEIQCIDPILQTIETKMNNQQESQFRRKDGSVFAVDVMATAMPDSNLLGMFRDITERKRNEARINYLANFDALTGLPNRTQLNNHLNYALSLTKRSNGCLALMFVDIDRFKDINDTLGHNAGDAFLIEISKRLKLALREEDTAVRLGGDEFILLLPGNNARGAAQVAQKILCVISKPYKNEHYDLIVTASIGIAIYPDDGSNMETLSKNADIAMHQAKQEGRNGYRFFTARMQAHAMRNLQLVNALRYALKGNQFQVYYQPQVSIRNGYIIGAEVLLRWHNPVLGNVSPNEFIPVAEDCGVILSIGEWVLRSAVMQLKRWIDNGHPPIIIAVNLSAVQFRHPNLLDMVTLILKEAQLPPEYLELELTEGAAMHEPLEAIAVMNNLHELGVQMSIDDFGTGYSSLNYLKKFKAYKLKIDQSFVRDINTDLEDKAIVAAIISMSKSLGLKTIAEGVETSEQLAFLREQGCDEAQGYYYSKPVPADQFERLLTHTKM